MQPRRTYAELFENLGNYRRRADDLCANVNEVANLGQLNWRQIGNNALSRIGLASNRQVRSNDALG